MGKFVIECPVCESYVTVSKFLHRNVTCTCGNEISVKNDKMVARVCPHCHNRVVYDQSKGEKAVCPVCKQKINTTENLRAAVDVYCPSCACQISVDKTAQKDVCPLCDTEFDVQQQIAKKEVKEKGLASVIKYEGGNDVFVWKHPVEDFNLGSQIIVHESQEAIFFRDGQALDLFGAGRYSLTTQSLPALEKLYKLPTNTDEIFHSEVYFINMTTQMGIKWGTDSKIRLFDPASNFHVELGACGEFNLRVENSRKFVLKVVGTTGLFTQSQVTGGDETKSVGTKTMVSHFKSLIVAKVKNYFAQSVKELDINVLELDSRSDELAECIRGKINEVLFEYGLIIPEFFITTIDYPKDKNFEAMREQFGRKTLLVREQEIKEVEAQTAARIKVVGAQGDAEALKIKAMAEAEAYKAQAMAEAAEMQAKGYTYQQETARQVGMEAMKNGIAGGEGGAAGSVIGDVASLGVTLGAMGGVIGLTKDALNPMINESAQLGNGIGAMAANGGNDRWNCTCGAIGVTGLFCSSCGAKKPEAWNCTCGAKGVTGAFCSNCGAKKPEAAVTWDCVCGAKGVTGNFCSVCGARKPGSVETWDCECGQKGIVGNFCNNCGKPKGGNS